MEVKNNGSRVQVCFSGRMTFMDSSKSETVVQLMNENKDKQIEFDLSELAFIDSSGLGMLIKFHHESETSGVKISFVNPSPEALKSLKAGHLDKYLGIKVT